LDDFIKVSVFVFIGSFISQSCMILIFWELGTKTQNAPTPRLQQAHLREVPEVQDFDEDAEV
jgi:hypothetical protein